MADFWEQAFIDKKKMWGDAPTVSATQAAELFKALQITEVLIPGIGYGRNAIPFLDLGMTVTGIEISPTAISYAKQAWGEAFTLVQGSVLEMPFDDKTYGGIFCHALIHLFKHRERSMLLQSCYHQLKEGGLMVFSAITKDARTYGVGELVEKDMYRTKDGVELFFYDEATLAEEFKDYGYKHAIMVEEPVNQDPTSTTRFWNVICEKG